MDIEVLMEELELGQDLYNEVLLMELQGPWPNPADLVDKLKQSWQLIYRERFLELSGTYVTETIDRILTDPAIHTEGSAYANASLKQLKSYLYDLYGFPC